MYLEQIQEANRLGITAASTIAAVLIQDERDGFKMKSNARELLYNWYRHTIDANNQVTLLIRVLFGIDTPMRDADDLYKQAKEVINHVNSNN